MAILGIAGLESLHRGLKSFASLSRLQSRIRDEAEKLAAAARANLEAIGRGEMARSVEIVERGQADRLEISVGSALPQAWFLEFGTRRMKASPWLNPALSARSRDINDALRKVVKGAAKSMTGT